MKTLRRRREDAVVLRDAVQRFVRSLGLLAADQTPCGQPLHVSEALAIVELGRCNGHESRGPTQRELGEHLGIDKSNVSRLCTRLLASGLIRSKPCLDDGRCKRITLTAKGKRLAASIDSASRNRFESIAETLSSECGQVSEALDALSNAMAQDS